MHVATLILLCKLYSVDTVICTESNFVYILYNTSSISITCTLLFITSLILLLFSCYPKWGNIFDGFYHCYTWEDVARDWFYETLMTIKSLISYILFLSSNELLCTWVVLSFSLYYSAFHKTTASWGAGSVYLILRHILQWY